MNNGQWWAVGLSDAVEPGHTLAVVCEGKPIVLFRDEADQAFALEDRCSHRRVPLSPGPVKPGGLQCPYHGWTFDGNSGRCTDIPNLGREERVPSSYGVTPYPVAEANGFIHVWLGDGAPGEYLPAASYRKTGIEYTGSAVVSLARDHYLDVMLDGPECLLAFTGVQITDFFLGDPRQDGDHLVLDRGAIWKGKGVGPAFIRDYPLVVRTSVPLVGGVITVELLSVDEEPLITICIAATENRRGTTSLCWRGGLHGSTISDSTMRWRFSRVIGRKPFEVFSKIDGNAIAALQIAPSLERIWPSSTASGSYSSFSPEVC